MLAVQTILDETSSLIKIIAKIENYEGGNNLLEIPDHSYGVMIARGDLAVEIPTEKILLIQKSIIRDCIERRKPVIVATHMLHSMIDSPRPIRAEVSDVANACLDQIDALMFSGETASGTYPGLAVRFMGEIAADLAKSAVKTALRLNTRGSGSVAPPPFILSSFYLPGTRNNVLLKKAVPYDPADILILCLAISILALPWLRCFH